jgi:hypothetical protein
MADGKGWLRAASNVLAPSKRLVRDRPPKRPADSVFVIRQAGAGEQGGADVLGQDVALLSFAGLALSPRTRWSTTVSEGR